MAENVYECMLILNSNRYARNPAEVSSQIEKIVVGLGGTMLASRLWEERKLAYPIAGQRKGTYWLTYFKLEGRQIDAVKRQCQLSDNILRTLVLKIDPRIADTLVSHALSSGTSQPAEKEEKAAGKATTDNGEAGEPQTQSAEAEASTT